VDNETTPEANKDTITNTNINNNNNNNNNKLAHRTSTSRICRPLLLRGTAVHHHQYQQQQQYDFRSSSSLQKRKESRVNTTGDPFLSRTIAIDGEANKDTITNTTTTTTTTNNNNNNNNSGKATSSHQLWRSS
jgi:hypothetical protein